MLDAVATRLGGSAAPLRSLADALGEAQVVVSAAVLDFDEAEHSYAVLEDRAAALCGAGRSEDDPDLLVIRHLQIEQVEVQQQARASHAAAAERFREADMRCATILRSLTVDGLADALPYRVLVGVSTAGHDLATLEPLATVVPELQPVVAVAGPVAVAADTALLVAYGEGDAAEAGNGCRARGHRRPGRGAAHRCDPRRAAHRRRHRGHGAADCSAARGSRGRAAGPGAA